MGVCHVPNQPSSSYCMTDKDCTAAGSYCMNDATKSAPYVCHVPNAPKLFADMVEAGPSKCPVGDNFCMTQTGNKASYCKYWQKDPAGRVCQGSNIRCSCTAPKPPQCPAGDRFCKKITGNAASYCKYWQKDPAGQVCQ